MQTLIKLTAILVIGCLFCGCSSKRIDVTTLAYGTSNKKDVTDMFGSWTSRKFHFRVHEKNYSFLKYSVPDSSDTVGFLFEDNELVAVKKAEPWFDVFGYDNCIVFPLVYEDNIHECFLNTTNDFIATRHPLDTLTFAPDDSDAFETFAVALEAATYATITVYALPPLAALAGAVIPVALVSEWQCSETQDELAAEFQLGEPVRKYKKLLDGHPGHTISNSHKGSSILIPSGFLFKQPAYSVGIHEGEIIWLDEQPFGLCDSGFSIKGCKLGNQHRSTEHKKYSKKKARLEQSRAPLREEDYGGFWEVSY